MRRVRVSWTETIEQVAVIEVGNPSDTDPEDVSYETFIQREIPDDIDSILADADSEHYAVTEREITNWEVL